MIAASETPQPPARPHKIGPWPLIIVGLLATHVGLMLWAVRITLRDPSFSVVPDYYNRAVSWDTEKAALAASTKLGWNLTIVPAGVPDAKGQRELVFTITDAAGHPLQNAALDVTFFHHAHGDQSQHINPTASGPVAGRFTSQVFMPYTGFYEYHVTATVGKDTFISSVTQYLQNDSRAATAPLKLTGGGPT